MKSFISALFAIAVATSLTACNDATYYETTLNVYKDGKHIHKYIKKDDIDYWNDDGHDQNSRLAYKQNARTMYMGNGIEYHCDLNNVLVSNTYGDANLKCDINTKIVNIDRPWNYEYYEFKSKFN